MTYGIYEGEALLARFVAPATVRSNRPIFASDTLSLKRKSSGRGAQRWEIEANLEPLTTDANALFVHLVTKGESEAFPVRVPQNYGVIQKRTSISTPLASGLKGSTVVQVTQNVGLIPMGTFIRFDNHSKIYMLEADLRNSGDMHIFPRLQKTVTGANFTHRDDVIMPCTYDTDVVKGMVYVDGILMDNGTIKLIEAL
jgi:hypothetical protein